LATSQGQLVVTQDADFGALAILQKEPLFGVLCLRPGHIDAQFTNVTIQSVVGIDPELDPPFILVAQRPGNHVSIRVRALTPQLPKSRAPLLTQHRR
jgi:predicted nuclease of predicted toxin-antitoxin system